MIDRFISARKGRWDRLAYLLTRVRGRRIAHLSAAEIEEFGVLYRETSSDLALARREYPRAPVTGYLNGLVAETHGLVYRSRGSGENPVAAFFAREFPAAFRRHARAVLFAFLAFILPALLAYGLVLRSPAAEAVLVPPELDARIAEVRRTGRWADISASESSLAASTIMTNNIRVAITAFAGGIGLGLLSLFVLAFNGLYLGAVAATAQSGGAGLALWSFVSPHGWIELTVIFIAGGAGLIIGRAVLLPGLLSRRDAIVAAAQEAVRLLLGGAALLVVAGIIEGFISPSLLPEGFKIVFGALTGLALFSYLAFAGRSSTHSDA